MALILGENPPDLAASGSSVKRVEKAFRGVRGRMRRRDAVGKTFAAGGSVGGSTVASGLRERRDGA